MIVNKIVTRDTAVVDDVICDKCMVSCKDRHYSGWHMGGYNSNEIGDGVAYSFDVCEACLLGWLKTFQRDTCENPDYRDGTE